MNTFVAAKGYVHNTSLPVATHFGAQLNRASMHAITSAPDSHLGNRTFPASVATVVGGGCVVNGMVFDRGSDAD